MDSYVDYEVNQNYFLREFISILKIRGFGKPICSASVEKIISLRDYLG